MLIFTKYQLASGSTLWGKHSLVSIELHSDNMIFSGNYWSYMFVAVY